MMSGKRKVASHARNAPDRRVSRTRATLLASFDRLLLTNGYENVSVRELTASADVGRSTFYEHFEGKHDLLEQSVARILDVVAAAATNGKSSDALLDVLTHVRERRVLASALLQQGSTRAILIRALALDLERQLAALARRSATPPIAPLAYLALSLAQVQLGAIDAWLNYDANDDVRMAARVLNAITRAGVVAAFEANG
jgi:AcrR family transcriptional regulator